MHAQHINFSNKLDNATLLSNHGRLSQLTSRLANRLAKASNEPKWILFTADTASPDVEELKKNQVECNKVIQLKPSYKSSEEEVVIKAIISGNASAIVASHKFDKASKAYLARLGSRFGCDVLFSEPEQYYLH